MPKITLKTVRVNIAVPFNGPSNQTLDYQHGTLELDTETGFVVATPKKTSGIAKQVIIPSGNIAFMEVLDTEKAKQVEEQKKAEAEALKAAKNAPKPVKDDTYRPTKPEIR